jgi:hypothetical protein
MRRGVLVMRILLLISGLLALMLSPAFAESASIIDPSLIVSTLHVKTDHLKVQGSTAPDIWYEVNNCRISPSAARKDFQNTLVTLLPVLLATYPSIQNIFIHGGCPMIDVYGRESFDDNAINAMFTRENLDKVVWKNVTPENLFDHVAHGRWLNPEMRP